MSARSEERIAQIGGYILGAALGVIVPVIAMVILFFVLFYFAFLLLPMIPVTTFVFSIGCAEAARKKYLQSGRIPWEAYLGYLILLLLVIGAPYIARELAIFGSPAVAVALLLIHWGALCGGIVACELDRLRAMYSRVTWGYLVGILVAAPFTFAVMPLVTESWTYGIGILALETVLVCFPVWLVSRFVTSRFPAVPIIVPQRAPSTGADYIRITVWSIVLFLLLFSIWVAALTTRQSYLHSAPASETARSAPTPSLVSRPSPAARQRPSLSTAPPSQRQYDALASLLGDLRYPNAILIEGADRSDGVPGGFIHLQTNDKIDQVVRYYNEHRPGMLKLCGSGDYGETTRPGDGRTTLLLMAPSNGPTHLSFFCIPTANGVGNATAQTFIGENGLPLSPPEQQRYSNVGKLIASYQRAESEVPALLGALMYPGSRVLSNARDDMLTPYPQILLETTDDLQTVLSYYEQQMPGGRRSPQEYVAVGTRPGDQQPVSVYVHPTTDKVIIGFHSP